VNGSGRADPPAASQRDAAIYGDAMSDAHPVITMLRQAHEAFALLVAPLDGDAIRRRSYCDDWSVAQVASHLGSGAELGLDWLGAAMAHTEPMGQEDMQKVWDKWNGRSPEEQVSWAVVAGAAQVEAFETATADQLAQAHIKLFGMLDLDGNGLARIRIPELVVHTWDIAVIGDPSARLFAPAVDLMIDELPARVGRFGKPQTRSWSLDVATTRPERDYVLRNGDEVSLEPGTAADADGDLRLPAEALIRLIYGRVDDRDGGDVVLQATEITLADLQAVFLGF
jgi:uncharacterized protein (TIGR03083 family)